MLIRGLTSVLLAIVVVVPAGLPAASDPDQGEFMEGLHRIIQASRTCKYFSYQTSLSLVDLVEGWQETTKDGTERVEWESPPVPEQFKGSPVTFVIACGFGSKHGNARHQLYVQDRYVGEFDTPDHQDGQWTGEGARLFFHYLANDPRYNETFGVMYITLDPQQISYGKSVAFKVVGKKEDSDAWFLLQNLTNNIEVLSKHFGRLKTSKEDEDSHLVFSKYPGGLYLVMSGGGEFRLTFSSGPHVAPRISPDSKKILFNSHRAGRMGVWDMALEKNKLFNSSQENSVGLGKREKRICDGDQAEWAPDGKKMVFRRNGEIWEMDLAAKQERRMSPPGWKACGYPSYSPDGKTLLLVCNDESKGKIFLVHSNPTQTVELLTQGDILSSPKFSPDGKRIVYQDGAHLYLMDLQSRNIRQITTAGGVQSWPIWSEDGEHLAFCQSPYVHGPWDVYTIRIKQPQTFGFLRADVDVAPGWRGKRVGVDSEEPVKGNTISVSDAEKEIVVANDWYVFVFSREKNKLYLRPKGKEKPGGELEMIAFDRQDPVAGEMRSVRIVKHDEEEAVVEVRFHSARTQSMRALYRILRSRPLAEITPVEDISKISFRADIDLVVAPDRLAGDMLVDAKRYSGPEVCLPRSNLLMGFLHQKNMLMIISPLAREMAAQVRKGNEENRFHAIEVTAQEGRFYVTLLPGEDTWYQTHVAASSQQNTIQTDWKMPLAAQWRLVLVDSNRQCSATLTEEDTAKQGGISKKIDAMALAGPVPALVYLYGRVWHTPLERLTPMDMLMDTLGIETGTAMLDLHGKGVGRQAKAEQGKRWRNIIENLKRLTEARGGYSKAWIDAITALTGQETIGLIKDLDLRIEEHRRMTETVRALTEKFSRQGDREKEFCEEIARKIERLQKQVAGGVLDEITGVQEAAGRLQNPGNRTKEAYEQFDRLIREAVKKRQHLLKTYRMFTEELRNAAGMAITEKGRLKGIGEEIRDLTRQMLEKEYYLEEG